MLGACNVVAMVPTVQPAAAIAFYRDVLGLKFVEDTPFAAVFEAGGRTLRVTKVESFVPLPFSLLGWDVADITAIVRALALKGVLCARYEGLAQDSDNIWEAPGGARVAWFKDPDGNLLSVAQMP